MTQINSGKLEFTGNWFIDAGILGFVNLMEEVYGWDLEELQGLLEKNQEEVYYKWFIFGYLFYHSKVRAYYKDIQEIRKKIFGEGGINQQIEKLAEEIRELEGEISKEIGGKEKEKIQKKLEKKKKKLVNLEENKKNKVLEIERKENELKKEKEKFLNVITKINVEDILENGKKHQDLNKVFSDFRLNLPPIARNFYIFNSSKIRNNWFLAFKYLYYLCKKKDENLKRLKGKNLTYEIYPDSTINPFLFSEDEFSNIGYTKPLSVNEISNALKLQIPIYVSLLSFEHAFEDYYERETIRNIFFYIAVLPVCYSINKRMRIKKEIATRQNRPQTILRLTISSIFDELVEKRVEFSLENMYIIEYKNIERQKLINVEYISIPKLQASIILDDVIRYNLNKQIQYRIIKDRDKRDKQYCWLIEEFIKGKPLYPIILNHITLVLNEETSLKWNFCFYSLIIEANILKFKKESEGKNKNIFSENYFDNYKSLINQIKKDIKNTSFNASLINQISKNDDTKKRIARELFNAIKKKNKNMFLNILLKNMNEKKELCANKNLNEWIFNKIIKNNNESFIMYGSILIMNLLRG
ncbi:MAG: hypothetical protein QXQ82_02640 [Candidatus Pacearchaeota archaeon]